MLKLRRKDVDLKCVVPKFLSCHNIDPEVQTPRLRSSKQQQQHLNIQSTDLFDLSISYFVQCFN